MHYKTVSIILLVSCIFAACGKLEAEITGESEGMEYVIELLAEDLGVPWGMTFVSRDEILITEKVGTIKKLNLSTKSVDTIAGAPQVLAKGQGGLLDVAVRQDYTEGDWIYFTYSKEKDTNGVTTLARARLDSNSLMNWQDLLITESLTRTGRHFGSRITFDDSGHIYFSVGDRGVRPNGQNLNTHAGSILRLNLDGTLPHDNPFMDNEGLAEIWSYGHRNPQGLSWDNTRKILWSGEHGPRGGDEINIILPANNYGWPVVSHGKEYSSFKSVGEATSKPGMVDPIKVYIPSIAPGSLLIYSGKAFPQWQGDLFQGALAMTHLNRVVVDTDLKPIKEERLLTELDERIRALTEGPDGYLYFSTDSGQVMRIKPRNSK